MAGLFGESWDDPKTALMLALAGGLLGGRGNLAQNLGAGMTGGLGAYQDARKTQMLAQQQEMQRKLMQQQIESADAQEKQRLAAMKQAEADRLAISDYMKYATTPQMPLGSTVMTPMGQQLMSSAKAPGFDPMQALARNVPVSALDNMEKYLGPRSLKQGEVLVDRTTNKPIVKNVDEWEDIGENTRGQKLIRNKLTKEVKAVGQGPLIGSISVGAKGENPFLSAFGEAVGKDQAAVLAEGRQAEDALVTISQLRKIAKSPSGISGGPVADWQTWMLGAANQFGLQLDPNRLANDQNYRAEAIGLVLQQAGSLSKATEKEMAMVRESIADPTKFNSVSLDMRLSVLENKAKRNVQQARKLQERIGANYPGRFPTLTSDTMLGAEVQTPPIPTPEQTRRSRMNLSLDDIMKDVLGQ